MENKVVIITGGSSGIGAATAIVFAENGYDVAITYKDNIAGAEDLSEKIKALGQKVVVVEADLRLEDEAKKIVDEVTKELGRVDVLVNNAGGYIKGDEWDGSFDAWIDTFKQNIVSVMNMSKYVCKIFEQQQSGVIVNIASRYSVSGNPEAPAYSAAKSGVVNLTQSYAKLLAPFGRANSISPAAANAGYWLSAPKDELEATISKSPFGKLVEPKEVAGLVLFLASDKASKITGQNILIGN